MMKFQTNAHSHSYNLCPGTIYNTYKDLCSAFNITPASSKGKPAQVRYINQYIKYKRKGRSYIIEEVYDKPHLYYPIPKRRDRRCKLPKIIYGDFIKAILLQELLQNDGTMIRSRIELMRILGIVNKSYNSITQSQQQHLILLKCIFYNNFKTIIDNSLNTLAHKNIIKIRRVINLVQINGTCKIASAHETKKIITTEKTIFHNSTYKIYRYNYQKDIHAYKLQMQNVLRSMGYDKCFYKYYIELNPEYHIEPLKPSDVDLGRKYLNEEVIEGMERIIKERHKQFTDNKLPFYISNSYKQFLLKPINECLDELKIFTNLYLKTQ